MKKVNKLVNGAFNDEGGIKEVSFKKISTKPLDFEIQPVLYGVFKGDYSVQTTHQRLEEGDYILGLRWEYISESGNPVTKKTFYVKHVGNNIPLLPESESMIVWDIIEQKYSWIKDYFYPCKRYHTRLPIPEEEWIVTINKQKALDEFQEKFGCILDHFDYTNKKEDLRYIPKKLEFDINKYIPSFFHDPREYKSSYKEEWYVSRGNGRKDPDNTLRISPRFASTTEYKLYLERTDLTRPLSAYIPEETIKHQGYKFLIKIHRGVHYNERKGIYYGQSVDVWYF